MNIKKVYIRTFGCQMNNLVSVNDEEKMRKRGAVYPELVMERIA